MSVLLHKIEVYISLTCYVVVILYSGIMTVTSNCKAKCEVQGQTESISKDRQRVSIRIFEFLHEKGNIFGFQHKLVCSHRKWLETGHF